MRTKPKDIGTRQETAICKFMNEWAGEAVCERVVLHGNRDNGDLRILVDGIVLAGESKHCKKYPNEKKIESFKEQTLVEQYNSGSDGSVLIVNLPGCGVRRYECWMQPSTWLLLHGVGDDERSPLKLTGKLRSLMRQDDNGWLRMTMSDFCHLCFGPSASKEE